MGAASPFQPAVPDASEGQPLPPPPQPTGAAEQSAELSAAGPVRSAGMVETAQAVLWSFFGVRGRRAHERDAVRLNPLYVILMGIALAAAFVVGLITLVRFVVS